MNEQEQKDLKAHNSARRKTILKWLIVALSVNAILFILSHFAHSWAEHNNNWSTSAWYAMTMATGITKGVLSLAIAFTLIL